MPIIDASDLYRAAELLMQTARDGFAVGTMHDAAVEMVNRYSGEMRDRFMDASHTPGDPWQDLAEATKRKRWRQAGNRGKISTSVVNSLPFPILYITGELYTSLTPGAPFNILDIQAAAITYGTSVFHAIYHQDGTRTEPIRTILVMPSTDLLQEFADLQANAITETLNLR